MDIGIRLREERERLAHTQDSFAALAAIGKRALIHYEKGERSPDAKFLAAIAADGADVLYILTGERSQAVAATELLPPRQRALLDNWAHADDAGKRVIEGTAHLAAQSAGGAAPLKRPRGKAA